MTFSLEHGAVEASLMSLLAPNRTLSDFKDTSVCMWYFSFSFAIIFRQVSIYNLGFPGTPEWPLTALPVEY